MLKYLSYHCRSFSEHQVDFQLGSFTAASKPSSCTCKISNGRQTNGSHKKRWEWDSSHIMQVSTDEVKQKFLQRAVSSNPRSSLLPSPCLCSCSSDTHLSPSCCFSLFAQVTPPRKIKGRGSARAPHCNLGRRMRNKGKS